MFVTPNSDPKHEDERMRVLKVWDPGQRNFLPPEGRYVGSDYEHHWVRLAQMGDVTILTGDDAKAAMKAADEAIQKRQEKELADAKAAEDEAKAKAKADADAAKKPSPSPAPDTTIKGAK